MNALAPLIHEDAHLLVFDKPSGLLSVPGLGPDKQDCLSARVQTRWPEAMIVHRLDMATSGLILMARGPEMQKTLSMAFEKRRMHKRYQAVVLGEPLPVPDGQGWTLKAVNDTRKAVSLSVTVNAARMDGTTRPLGKAEVTVPTDAAVPVLGLRTITFWQALELQILAGLIFGRTGASSK